MSKKKSPPCLPAKVSKYDPDHKTIIQVGSIKQFFTKVRCQHYSSRHVFQCVVILDRRRMPHPGIVTVLWSITVTSEHALSVSTWVKSVKWKSGIFIWCQDFPHKQCISSCLTQIPMPMLVRNKFNYLYIKLKKVWACLTVRLQRSRMSHRFHCMPHRLWKQ